MNKRDKIFLAGHRGLVGSAAARALDRHGFTNVAVRTRAELDLADQHAVHEFFEAEKPDAVILAAAKVGGIRANSAAPADFIYQNIAIQTNVIGQAYRRGVKRLVFLGSSCIYPKLCPQPIKEEFLLTGPLEPTNEAYAVAKICGIKMCQSFNAQYGTKYVQLMPTNLYGPGDNFNPDTSHVLPALIRRFYEAAQNGLAEVRLWGTGTPRREFLHVDDLAEAVVHFMELDSFSGLVNIGTGRDVTIGELAGMVASETGFGGKISFDPSQPDGTPRKLLDVALAKTLGWTARIPLAAGLKDTCRWYRDNKAGVRN